MCELAESDHWDGILVHFYMPNTPNVSLSLSLSHTHTHTHTDFPGVPVVKSSPANSGDTGSLSALGRFPCHVATRPMQTKEACMPKACAPQEKKPLQ